MFLKPSCGFLTMDPVTLLTYIAVILLIGVIISALAKKIKFPDVLLFIILGMIFSSITYKGQELYRFPVLFITSISILALAMIVFESSVKIKLKYFDTFSMKTIRLVFFFFFFELIFLSIATFFIFKIPLPISILFATIMVGTAPSVIIPLLEDSKSKLVNILKFESIINTPLTVLFPFLVFDLLTSVEKTPLATTFIEQIGPFLAKFVSGLGAGLLIGLILLKVVKKNYSKIYSPLAVILAALLAYVVAENLGGNGVLAVTTLGVFFGNVYFKEKVNLLAFESVLAKSLYILVFVLIGSIIKIPYTQEFFLKAGLLFFLYLLIRYFAISVALRKESLTQKNKMFMTLVCPKGIAVVVVIVVLSSYGMEELTPILDIGLFFVIASISVSSIACWFKKYLIQA